MPKVWAPNIHLLICSGTARLNMISTLPWISTARTVSSVSTSPTSSTWNGWRRRWRSARPFLKKAARKKLKMSVWRSTKHFARWVANAYIFWWIQRDDGHKSGNWKRSSKWEFSCELVVLPLNGVKQGHFYAETHGDASIWLQIRLAGEGFLKFVLANCKGLKLCYTVFLL